MSYQTIEEIVEEVTNQFRTFGGGQTSEWNPISAALSDHPPQFAAGVDVEDVVKFIARSLE